MYRLNLICIVYGLAVLLCLLPLPTFAQAAGPNGFFYPVATLNPSATFLQTGCHGYIAGDYHLGWDLLQNHGTPVYAITGGTIVNITNTGDPDITFIWIKHQAVDPSNGNTFSFWAVYGHTSIKPGLSTSAPNNIVHAGDVIGYTIVYTPSVDHCHFGINLNGIITVTKSYKLNFVSISGQNASATITAGWGRGGLPSGWCGHDSQNIPLLQASGAVENFTDPQTFLNTYHDLGFGGTGTDIYVSTGGNDSNNGSSGSPYRTVAHAIAQASNTQSVTIHITPGTYGEKISTSKHILFVTWGSGTVRIGG